MWNMSFYNGFSVFAIDDCLQDYMLLFRGPLLFKTTVFRIFLGIAALFWSLNIGVKRVKMPFRQNLENLRVAFTRMSML